LYFIFASKKFTLQELRVYADVVRFPRIGLNGQNKYLI